jgi:hypothetical protein
MIRQRKTTTIRDVLVRRVHPSGTGACRRRPSSQRQTDPAHTDATAKNLLFHQQKIHRISSFADQPAKHTD